MPTTSHSNLAHKRKKIVKYGERLFLHSYSFGVAQQCNWLTTLPYVLSWIPCYFPSSLIASLLSERFVLTFVFLALRNTGTRVYMYICEIPFSSFLSALPLLRDINSSFLLSLFLPLSLSLAPFRLSLHFQSGTVLGNASIRF